MSKGTISLFIIALTINTVFSIENYCSKNTYETNGTHMQFTKEPNFEEFATIGSFKGLHCCAKNYRSIEWYKNGKPYPWPITSSQLILYPEDGNQTVYTRSVTETDAGNYTCILRNDTVVHAHTISLKIIGKVPDEPLVTYISGDTEASIGGSLRLFCEAFGGRIDLPDAHNEANWYKMNSNRVLWNESRIRQEKISREDDQTFGTYLLIEDIRQEDFGTYVCTITKPGVVKNVTVTIRQTAMPNYVNPNPFPVEKMLILTITVALVLLAFFVLNLRYGIYVRVRYKDTFGPIEEGDGKIDDALILFSEKEETIALNVILPKLEKDFNYKVGYKKVTNSVDDWLPELKKPAEKSRRVIILLSPGILKGSWDGTTIYKAVKVLGSLGPAVICVNFEDIPVISNQAKNAQGETLKSALNSVHLLRWTGTPNEKWWVRLLIKMPAKRSSQFVQQNASRLNRQESLDNLV